MVWPSVRMEQMIRGDETVCGISKIKYQITVLYEVGHNQCVRANGVTSRDKDA